MAYSGKAIMEHSRYHGLQDSNPNTSRINCGHSLSTGVENKFMFTVAHVLSPEMIKALATRFSALNPKPLGGAPKELAATGKKIYEQGIPDTNVPPCANCHGPDAKGNGPFPRLAGQLDDYVVRKLVNWDKERGQDPAHPDTSALMEPIAHSLSESQINAVAAYLNSLE